MTLNEKVVNMLGLEQQPTETDLATLLNEKLRLLSKWRSALIQNTILQKEGATVSDGPFKGMRFIDSSAEGCHVAKLIGCYEQPLHKIVDEITAKGYENVINIGCAEGYYAVGIALKNSNVKVHAYDLDENARKSCASLAEKNGVKDQIQIGAEFSASELIQYRGSKTLIFCDIEGAEQGLFTPETVELSRHFDLVIESHECLVPGITDTLKTRFSKTHVIQQIDDDGMRSFNNLPNWFSALNHLDQLLAVWEWRSGPTPWLVLRSKL